jgi:membrane protein DedA with SNARE-associated domain
METWISHYGYWAIILGTFLEGETILIIAGFAAHRGYLNLSLVICAACVGTLVGDQLFFYLGRRHSDFLLQHKPRWRPRLERATQLIANYRLLIILSFRFLYGLRSVTPFALGLSKVPMRLFIPLNIIGAMVWAVAIGLAGYYFGQALELLLGDIKHYEHILLIGMAGAGTVIWLIHAWRTYQR